MEVRLNHCNTIVSNSYEIFGAVPGCKLDPRLDHIINVQLIDGVEFGVGICDQTQLEKNQRDFMCNEGGYGYYNYRTMSPERKPKYPPGLYYQALMCRKHVEEVDICRAGDVLTMVVQRENVKSSGGESYLCWSFGSKRLESNPMNKLQATAKHTLSFYKNGADMGFHLRNLTGPFYLYLNYYFVETKIRLLSDYNFRQKYSNWLRVQSRQTPNKDSKGLLKEGPKRFATMIFL